MSNIDNEKLMDKLTKVCICKAISRAQIKDAISNGADTLDKVKDATKATTGGCCGSRCKNKIIDLIEQSKN
ncbi:(2Fe-2S)-binding protein [Clostridium frigidicarnis]|uniref:BFD-like [2Fe-2S] binding domain-containing protein n=1 Tax=Clostridium frigidicarnis TaxID=84698 RepID=A0A1I0YPI5_9CLOT|nr:(2Fe-2S)-binding protein [Clostridium frigidicarnis]SFB15289.1 BFD-like [2Fe-2S] binding domain-containing protein [Clostridium frigidicarnis]